VLREDFFRRPRHPLQVFEEFLVRFINLLADLTGIPEEEDSVQLLLCTVLPVVWRGQIQNRVAHRVCDRQVQHRVTHVVHDAEVERDPLRQVRYLAILSWLRYVSIRRLNESSIRWYILVIPAGYFDARE